MLREHRGVGHLAALAVHDGVENVTDVLGGRAGAELSEDDRDRTLQLLEGTASGS